MTQWLVIQALCRVILALHRNASGMGPQPKTTDLYMLNAAIEREGPPPQV